MREFYKNFNHSTEQPERAAKSQSVIVNTDDNMSFEENITGVMTEETDSAEENEDHPNDTVYSNHGDPIHTVHISEKTLKLFKYQIQINNEKQQHVFKKTHMRLRY